MIYMQLDGLPPSVNKAYFDQVVRKGKDLIPVRRLTKEGKKYKTETASYLARKYPQEMKIFHPDVSYGLIVIYWFPTMLNKSWPGGAKTRYKKLDTNNRPKLFEDALASAAGVDDSQFIFTGSCKRQGPPCTEIWVWNMDKEVPHELFQLPGLWSM